ncbi:MAG: hypothetical protein E7135_02600 [Rikenellaceae bacterium]|nr:hypothetical protein [Rikenellaceae bacterium]
MTRKITLLLATIALAVSAQASTNNNETGNTATPATTPTPTTALPSDVEDDDEGLFWWEAGANITSNYLWRGYDQSYYGNIFDPAIQPSVTLGLGAFYVDLWYNYSTLSTYQELDITLGFDYENLSITVYDVWCDYGKAFWQNDFLDDENHSLTATIEYTLFDRLRLHWGTTFLHAADWLYNDDGSKRRRAFSSYFEVAYTQPVKELFDIEITAGASPWTAPFWCAGPRKMVDGGYELDFDNLPEGFNVTNLSLQLSREFEVGAATIPVSVGYTYNPTSNRHYALINAGVAF